MCYKKQQISLLVVHNGNDDATAGASAPAMVIRQLRESPLPGT